MEALLQHEAVGAKGFLVEEDAFLQMHRVKQFLVVVLEEAVHLDSQLFQKANRHLAVIAGGLDGLRPPYPSSNRLPAWNSLRLAWPPKSSWLSRRRILDFCPGKLAVEVGCRQAADTGADHDQIVGLTVVD